MQHLNSENLTRDILERHFKDSKGYFGWKDKESRYIRLSKDICNALGISSPYDATGRFDKDYFPDEMAETFVEDDQIAMKNGYSISVCETIFFRQKVLTFGYKTSIYDHLGQLDGCFAYCSLLPEKISGQLSYMLQTNADLHSYYSYTEYQKSLLIKDPVAPIELTPIQEVTLYYVIRGDSCREIAERVNRSVRTVEWRLNELKAKFDVSKKSELIARAIELGYLNRIPATLL